MTPVAAKQALLFASAAILGGVNAWYQTTWLAPLRLGAALFALVCAVLFLLWLSDMLAYLLAQYRMSWYAPVLRQMEILSRMDKEQINALERGKLMAVGRLVPSGGIEWSIRGVGMDFDLHTWEEMVTYCLEWPKFPELPPQHGLPENDFRRKLQAFTSTVVQNGHAVAGSGNQPARWKVENDKIVLNSLMNGV